MKHKRLTDDELWKVFELLNYEEHHGIFCTQLFNKIRPMAEELRERRYPELKLCDAVEKDKHGKCKGRQVEFCEKCPKRMKKAGGNK